MKLKTQTEVGKKKKEMEERFNVTDELNVPLKTRFFIYEVNLSRRANSDIAP